MLYRLFSRDAVLVTVADTLTAIFCGFVIFSGLGYMAHQTGTPVLDVVRTGANQGAIFTVQFA